MSTFPKSRRSSRPIGDAAGTKPRLSDEEALAALTEKHYMMAGENRVLDFWYDGFIVADDARQDAFAAFKMAYKILAHFFAHRQNRDAAFFELP